MSYLRIFVPRRWVKLDTRSPLERSLKLSHMQRLMNGNHAAGREFNMNETNVRQWRRLKDRLQKMPRSKMADRGSSAHFPELEALLCSAV